MTATFTPEQAAAIRSAMVPAKETLPVRFLKEGRAMELETGTLSSKGSNVMYHPVYWNFTPKTAAQIAKWTGTKALFSE